MPITTLSTSRMRTLICRTCGEPFYTRNSNQKNCDDHLVDPGRRIYFDEAKIQELKRAADLSGNPKIYTSKEYSQEFLRGLIPGGQSENTREERNPETQP